MVLIYGLLALMLLYLYAEFEDVPAIYLPTGVLWAGLMLLQRRAGLVLLSGAFVAQMSAELLVYQSPPGIALVYSLSKTLEAYVGVSAVQWAIGERLMRPQLEHVGKFVVIGCILVPLLFAIPPEIVRRLVFEAPRNDLYFHWTILQGTGVAIAAPLIVFASGDSPMPARHRTGEIIALILISIAVYAFVFVVEPRYLQLESMLYLAFPPLIWAATRFGCRGASISNFFLATIAISAAIALGLNEFPTSQLRLSVIAIELFILVTATISLILGAFAEERERAITLQRSNRERLNALSLRLVENEENYRLKMATLLHDDVGQMLAVSKLRLKLAERAPEVAPDIKSELSQVAKAIDDAIESTRRITRESVSTLYPVGKLVDAIDAHLHNICDGLPVAFSLQSDPLPDIDPSLSIVVTRCVRECIVNVIKHAKASRIDLQLTQDGGALVLRISDDGSGFDVDAVDRQDPRATTFGLVSVENAIDALGGRLDIRSDDGGTRVVIRVPVI